VASNATPDAAFGLASKCAAKEASDATFTPHCALHRILNLIKGFGFYSISVIVLKFADADSLNGTRQKHGALCGGNSDEMVNILATRCWRLENHFAARTDLASRCKTPVGYAQNPSRHFV
jgi:hypothetical protein